MADLNDIRNNFLKLFESTANTKARYEDAVNEQLDPKHQERREKLLAKLQESAKQIKVHDTSASREAMERAQKSVQRLKALYQ